jgi:hypothetical protein
MKSSFQPQYSRTMHRGPLTQGYVVVVTARYCGADRLKRVLTFRRCPPVNAALARAQAPVPRVSAPQPGPSSAGSARDLRCQRYWRTTASRAVRLPIDTYRTRASTVSGKQFQGNPARFTSSCSGPSERRQRRHN